MEGCGCVGGESGIRQSLSEWVGVSPVSFPAGAGAAGSNLRFRDVEC